MIKSSEDTKEYLLERYSETGDEKYLNEWKHSSGPFVYALRLSNVTSSMRMKYGTELDPKHSDMRGRMEVIEPDIISYGYEVVIDMIDKWDPERAKFSTYLYRYGPSRVMRLYARDMWEQEEDFEEFYKTPEERHVENEVNLTVREIYDTIHIWGSEEDLPILSELKGEITAKESAERLGMVYGHSYIKRRDDTLFRLRNFLQVDKEVKNAKI